MLFYADTSSLFSYYVTDGNSAAVRRLFATLPHPLAFTLFHRVELVNALELAVFRGRLGKADTAAVWRDVAADFRSGLLRPPVVNWTAALRKAAKIARARSATNGVRSLDIVHVALALECGCTDFITFDQRQSALARAEGMNVMP